MIVNVTKSRLLLCIHPGPGPVQVRHLSCFEIKQVKANQIEPNQNQIESNQINAPPPNENRVFINRRRPGLALIVKGATKLEEQVLRL